MWLRRFIEHRLAASALMLGIALASAGCASSYPGAAVPPAGESAAAPVSDEQAPMALAPPQALTMFKQAAALMAGGDFDAAERHLQAFLLRYPGYPAAHVNLAILYSEAGDDAAVQREIDAALALDPVYAPALNQQGLLFRRNGKFLEAEAAYLKAVTAAPDYALAHYNLGVLNELYLQRLDTALKHFERYQELVGEDKQVEKWISDLRRRVAANQRTANVAE
ncbi:tetratricopeptide repeat protein [Gammaproteobacteria bacterium]|jgi:tetratricopeptide (TPR) repeat protein|nr:tetratricopeptide repeat protein [Gammaproteobacteria bacterium]